MLYTVDKINENKDFLPGVKIGVHILDDCDKDTYGLEQAVEFIKGEFFYQKMQCLPVGFPKLRNSHRNRTQFSYSD